MSNEIIKGQKVTSEDVAKVFEAQPLAGETLYTRDEINAQPSAFGVMPEVLAGALASVEGESLSRSQVKAAIEKFKTRRV